jgi:hypothetical protein
MSLQPHHTLAIEYLMGVAIWTNLVAVLCFDYQVLRQAQNFLASHFADPNRHSTDLVQTSRHGVAVNNTDDSSVDSASARIAICVHRCYIAGQYHLSTYHFSSRPHPNR